MPLFILCSGGATYTGDAGGVFGAFLEKNLFYLFAFEVDAHH